MNSQNRPTKKNISKEHEIEILRQLACFVKPEEIIERSEKEWGVKINHMILANYKKGEKYKPLIDKQRHMFLSELAEVPGCHKRIRLERAEKIYEKCFEEGDYAVAISAIKFQKDELEEKLGGGNTLILQLNQFNSLTDSELEERRTQLLERIKTFEGKKVEQLEFKGESDVS